MTNKEKEELEKLFEQEPHLTNTSIANITGLSQVTVRVRRAMYIYKKNKENNKKKQ